MINVYKPFFCLCHYSPNVLKIEEQESKTTCSDSEGEVYIYILYLVHVYAPSLLNLRRRGGSALQGHHDWKKGSIFCTLGSWDTHEFINIRELSTQKLYKVKAFSSSIHTSTVHV